MASISTRTPLGRAPTSNVVRAGGGSGRTWRRPRSWPRSRRCRRGRRRLDDVGEADAGRVEHGAEVAQRALGLRLDAASTSSPVAGSTPSWPAQKTRSPATMAWLYGPTAAGAAVVAMAWRVMGWARWSGRAPVVARPVDPDGRGSMIDRRVAIAESSATASPIVGSARRRRLGGRRCRLRPRAKDRASRGSGRSRTARSAGRAGASAPGARRPARARRGRPPAAGRWPRRGRPARATGRVADSPLPELLGEVLGASSGPSRRPADAARRRRPRRRRACGPRRPASRAGRPGCPWTPAQRRHALAAALDERRAAGAGRTARPSRRSRRRARRRSASRRRRPTPRARRRTRPRASDEPPPSPAATGMCFSRRAASGGRRRAAGSLADRRAGGRDAAQDEVVVERAGVAARARGGCPPGPRRAGRGEAQPIGQAERHEHRVEVVEPVGPAPDDGQGQVELGRGEPDDRREPGADRAWPRSARRRRCGRASRRRSGRGPRAGRATPRPRASGAGGRGRCRPPPGRPSTRVRVDRQLARRARCGASCGARGTPAWTSRHSCPRPRATSRSSASNGSTTMTADSTAGSGSNASGRHAERDADPGVVLHEHRQVAHLPGRRRDPLGDLALDHEHEPAAVAAARPGARAGSALVMWYGRFATTSYGGSTQLDEVLVERVALDRAQAGPPRAPARSARAGTRPGRGRARRP